MFRYFAALWDPANPEQIRESKRIEEYLLGSSLWRIAVALNGLSVFVTGTESSANESLVLPNRGGVIIGKLFRKLSDDASAHWSPEVSAAESQRIIDSHGQRLIQDYWGRYVAFVRRADDGSTWVFQDPTRALPCLRATTALGVKLFFSRVQDCEPFVCLTLDWAFIASFICYPAEIHQLATGLREVTQIPTGTCLELDRHLQEKSFVHWDAIELARRQPIEDVPHAVDLVRTTVQSCVWAWASCYPRLLHQLSGGLDSSVVLSCLMDAPTKPALTCINYFDPSASAADERAFARLAAAAASTELLEVDDRQSADNVSAVLGLSRAERPWLAAYYHSELEMRIARDRGATAIFQGAGGDQVFYQNPIPLAAADHLKAHGPTPRFLRFAAQVARAEGMSFWQILGIARRATRRRRDPGVNVPSFPETAWFVVPSIAADARQRLLAAAHSVPQSSVLAPGKRLHSQYVQIPHDFYDALGLPDFPERVRPLVAQPVIELCLRIPTYVLAADGVDRALVRRAFLGKVPRPILERRAKGVVNQTLQSLLERNLGFVREMLLDGALVEHGILRRDALEAVLYGRRSVGGHEAGTIISIYLSTECWIRSWIAGSDSVPRSPSGGAIEPLKESLPHVP